MSALTMVREPTNDDIAKLSTALSTMLMFRAADGNCQSKHGFEAAYDYEVFRFVDALNKLTKDHKP